MPKNTINNISTYLAQFGLYRGECTDKKYNPANLILEYCNNLALSPMGLGCMAITPANNTIVEHAINNGITLFDTSDCYLNGECETALSAVVKKHDRSKLTICTKVGVQFNSHGIHLHGDQKYIAEACTASLQRLQTDYIDFYYLHRVDPNTLFEESVRALGMLAQQGKVKHIGLSEVTADQIRRANKIHPVSAVQIEYSPWSRQDESNGVIATCAELGIVVVAYSPLGRAFFTQQNSQHFMTLPNTDFRRILPRYAGGNLQKNIVAREKIQKLADKKKCTLAQLVLAWEIAKGLVPIPATTDAAHFNENIAALKIKLSPTEIAEFDAVINQADFAGPRYPDEKISAIYPEPSAAGTAQLK